MLKIEVVKSEESPMMNMIHSYICCLNSGSHNQVTNKCTAHLKVSFLAIITQIWIF